MGTTSIEWTNRSLNPIRARYPGTNGDGHYCEKVSHGCTNCYASRLQPRFGMPVFETQRRGGVEPYLHTKVFDEVLRRRTPTKWFWCDMTDLFGPWVPDEWIDQCFAVMALTPHHVHQVLTKRPDRMRSYMDGLSRYPAGHCWEGALRSFRVFASGDAIKGVDLPLPNVWLGVSCEDQQRADERIPLLLQTPARVRFISAEPLLGPVDLSRWLNITWTYSAGRGDIPPRPGITGGWWSDLGVMPHDDPHLDWVIVGGESGAGARPCSLDWVRSIVEQCRATDGRTKAFVKQLGADPFEPYHDGSRLADVRLRSRKGGDMSEWAEELRVREFPEVRP